MDAGGLSDIFPIIYVRNVTRMVEFYSGLLGFEETYRFPPNESAGYVALRRGAFKLALADVTAPREILGLEPADRPRSELCGYAEDPSALLSKLRLAGVAVLREPELMPWGEQMAYVADPEGNPIQLIQAERKEATSGS